MRHVYSSVVSAHRQRPNDWKEEVGNVKRTFLGGWLILFRKSELYILWGSLFLDSGIFNWRAASLGPYNIIGITREPFNFRIPLFRPMVPAVPHVPITPPARAQLNGCLHIFYHQSSLFNNTKNKNNNYNNYTFPVRRLGVYLICRSECSNQSAMRPHFQIAKAWLSLTKLPIRPKHTQADANVCMYVKVR